MTRSSIFVASVFTLIALPSILAPMTTPVSAQEPEWSDSNMSDGNLRDLLRNWVGDSPDRRDMVIDLLQERQDRRAEPMDRLHDRMDRRDRRRERISSRWDDDEEDGISRGRGDLRDRLRERISSRGEDDEDGSRRGRLRERLADRHGGNCYFLTRSLRAEDRTLLVVVRRRVCRD